MSTQPATQAAPDGAVRLRRKFDDYIGAIYRIAFGRPGDHDIFRNARVAWTDFIPPILLFLLLHLGYTIGSSPAILRAMNLGLHASLLVLAILGGGVLLRLAVALLVTWLLGKLLSAPERIVPGLLGYLWTLAALVSPGIMVVRWGVSPHDPWWSLTLTGVAAVVVAIWWAARIMRVAFGLPGMGSAIFIALGGNVVSYLVDFLVTKLWV